MKIAFLSFYSGKIDRGVEVATEALASGLSQNHEVTIFQVGERQVSSVKRVIFPLEKKWPKDTSSSPLRFFFADYYSRKIAQFTFAFLPYLFKEKFDVVIPTNGGWQVTIIRLVTWILGKKMMVQGNAGIGRDDLWQLLNFPNYFIAISPQGYRWVEAKCPWVKKIYIPHGVDLTKIKQAKVQNIPLAKPIVLCVSAFLAYKQIDLLIRAVRETADMSLLVIGQGPLEKELNEMGQRLLGKRFLLLTNISHENLFGYYKVAQIFSLPSKSSEAFGIVYIEALAAGVPVVAPDDKNRRELIGEAGEFVNPEDTKQFALTLERILKRNFGVKPQEQAKKYSWETIIKQYQQLLASL